MLITYRLGSVYGLQLCPPMTIHCPKMKVIVTGRRLGRLQTHQPGSEIVQAGIF